MTWSAERALIDGRTRTATTTRRRNAIIEHRRQRSIDWQQWQYWQRPPTKHLHTLHINVDRSAPSCVSDGQFSWPNTCRHMPLVLRHCPTVYLSVCPSVRLSACPVWALNAKIKKNRRKKENKIGLNVLKKMTHISRKCLLTAGGSRAGRSASPTAH